MDYHSIEYFNLEAEESWFSKAQISHTLPQN